MIFLKKIISENTQVSPRDIYNFFYLWYQFNHAPELFETHYGKHILNEYLNNLKSKFVNIFSTLIEIQIQKYIKQQRIDQNFPYKILPPSLSPEKLLELIKKTWRSDMTRRNTNWIMLSEFVVKLFHSKSSQEKFLYLNQILNSIHNTGNTIMDKLGNYHNELQKSLDFVHKIENIKNLIPWIDNDLKQLTNQEI